MTQKTSVPEFDEAANFTAAKLADKSFKHYKKEFSDIDYKPGVFKTPNHLILCIEHRKHFFDDIDIVGHTNFDIVGGVVDMGKITASSPGEKIMKCSAFRFLPMKNERAIQRDYDTDAFVVIFDNEKARKKAFKTICLKLGTLKFATKAGDVLTIRFTNGVH